MPLNVHFHVLFLDGVYVDSVSGSSPRFRWVKAPTSAELTHPTHTIAHRVGRFLERQGLLEREGLSRINALFRNPIKYRQVIK